MSAFSNYQVGPFNDGLSIIREEFQDSAVFSNKNTTVRGKPMDYRFKAEHFGDPSDEEEDTESCPANTRSTWPTEIQPWWNPSNRYEKPPYSYATMIAHAILSSKTGRLTLNDIYTWIAENYPFYKIQKNGWKNSVRHNLSLKKKWFAKCDRKPTKSRRRGCYWVLQANMEKVFVDSLSRIGNHGHRLPDFELVIDSNSISSSDSDDDDAILTDAAQNIRSSRRSDRKDKKNKFKTTKAPRIRNMSHDRSFTVPPPKTDPKNFVFRVNEMNDGRKNPPRPRPKAGKRRKQAGPDASSEDGNDSGVESEYKQPVKNNMPELTPVQSNDVHYTNEPMLSYTPDLIEDILTFDPKNLYDTESYSTPEQNILYGLQEPGLQSEMRTIDVKTDSIAKQTHCPMTFDTTEFYNLNGYYYDINDATGFVPVFYEQPSPLATTFDCKNIFWNIDEPIPYDGCLPGDQFDGCFPGDEFLQFEFCQ